MNFTKFFSQQARKPTGIFGRFYMSRVFDRGNAELNALTYETLSLGENDHVLEIGFGTGTLIRRIADHLVSGLIEGVDFSESMVAIARKRNRKFINSGRVQIHLGDFDKMRFEAGGFNKIFSVNTIYFWKTPDLTISRICRLLKPGGTLVIGFHDKTDMEEMALNTDVFRYYSKHEVTELLSTVGSLRNVDIVSKEGRQMTCYCAVGTR